MEEGGNKMGNAIYESKIAFDEKISQSCAQSAADEFLHQKYALKAWFSQSAAKNYVNGTNGLSALKGHKSDLSISQHNNSSGALSAAELGYEDHTVDTEEPQSDAVRRRKIRRASIGGGSSRSLAENDAPHDDCGFVVKTSSHSKMESFSNSDGFEFGESFGCDANEEWLGDSNENTSAPLKSEAKPATSRVSQGQPTRRAPRRRNSINVKDAAPAAPMRRQGGGLSASIHGGSKQGIVNRAQRRGSLGISRSDEDLTQARHRMRRRSMDMASNGNPRSNSDPLLAE
ncbi:MAG: hypothetical protein SGILL_008496, partial [Bacillariaceae sp.]